MKPGVSPTPKIHQQAVGRLCLFAVLILATLLAGCGFVQITAAPTPYPTQFLPTLIAETMEAVRAWQPTHAAVMTPTSSSNPPTVTLAPPTTTAMAPTPNQAPSLPQAVTPASAAPIPDALIQIRTPGPYSRAVSPLAVQAYLKPGKGGQVQVDLFGEDWRVLVRQIKPLPYINRYGYATLYTSLTFEIPGTAEAAWLTLSVNDEFGRVTSVNAVPLVLMALGEADIILPADVSAPIVIQQPAPMTLVQGKKLIASGLARSGGDTYLMLQLITQEGKVVGKRVTDIQPADNGGMGTFTAEVPYDVTEVTPALLVVWQGEGSMANVIYLSSVEVLLSP